MIQKSVYIQETDTSNITIPAPGAGKYICLTSVDAESDNAAGASVTIQSPAATNIWQHGILQNESIFKTWGIKNPLIGLENTAVVIAVSAGNFTINVSGFVTP